MFPIHNSGPILQNSGSLGSQYHSFEALIGRSSWGEGGADPGSWLELLDFDVTTLPAPRVIVSGFRSAVGSAAESEYRARGPPRILSDDTHQASVCRHFAPQRSILDSRYSRRNEPSEVPRHKCLVSSRGLVIENRSRLKTPVSGSRGGEMHSELQDPTPPDWYGICSLSRQGGKNSAAHSFCEVSTNIDVRKCSANGRFVRRARESRKRGGKC